MVVKDKSYRVEESSGYFTYEYRFKTIFLDSWYKKSPESFNVAYVTYDAVGNDMINSLEAINPELFENTYKQAFKTRVKEVE